VSITKTTNKGQQGVKAAIRRFAHHTAE